MDPDEAPLSETVRKLFAGLHHPSMTSCFRQSLGDSLFDAIDRHKSAHPDARDLSIMDYIYNVSFAWPQRTLGTFRP